MIELVLIITLVDGGEIRERASIEDCIRVNAYQLRANATGARNFAIDRTTGVKKYVAFMRCEEAKNEGAPTS